MTTISVSAARARLQAVLAEVEAGEEVTLTRHGKPVAVLVRPDALAHRRHARLMATADLIGALLDRAGTRPLPPATMAPDRAEELIAEIRAGRESRSPYADRNH